MPASKLVKPSTEYQDSFLEAVREAHAEGRLQYLDIPWLKENFATFVDRLNAARGHPHRPYQSWVETVPETILWLVKDGTYIGSVFIRHRLNWHLEKWGGHMNFAIRPSMRGKGYGKKILIKAMPYANYLGLETVMMTVDPYDKTAIRVVESAGAVLEDELPATDKFPGRLRYWLDCG
ncbi:MAG: GNAT family N-acetyltransferase [Alphaproteobacteria bacterium]|nr:GNAT family N-acetyltransferase [Alphaproteobacteria bacterium]